jgi:hypothetical protein
VRGIIADVNIEGHVDRLMDVIRATVWSDFWNDLGLGLEVFGSIGLASNARDAEVWRTCQQEQLVLITANRNSNDPDSLEAVIRSEGLPTSLPVLTIGEAKEVFRSSHYAERVAARMLEILDEIDHYRGAGRLYLP